MNFLTACFPQSWVPFQDPSPDNISNILNLMSERIKKEDFHSSLNPNEYECHPNNLKRFLIKHFLDLEVSLIQWHAWVEWRHGAKVDEITEEEIEFERNEGIFRWQGKNKENMKCCIITGRNLDPINRKGTYASYKKHLIKFIEEGMIETNTLEQDKVCIIYDRRGLEFENIDTNLFQICKNEVDQMRDWYSDRIGAIYILHTNVFFWILYTIISPIFSLLTSNNKLIVLENPEDLLEYFDSSDLFLLSPTNIEIESTEKNSSSV